MAAEAVSKNSRWNMEMEKLLEGVERQRGGVRWARERGGLVVVSAGGGGLFGGKFFVPLQVGVGTSAAEFVEFLLVVDHGLAAGAGDGINVLEPDGLLGQTSRTGRSRCSAAC